MLRRYTARALLAAHPPAAEQRRCLGSLNDIASESARLEDGPRDAPHPAHHTRQQGHHAKLRGLLRGMARTDGLQHILSQLRDGEAPESTVGLLRELGQRAYLSDMQLLHATLWMVSHGYIERDGLPEFCRAVGQQPNASFRAHSALCACAAKQGSADLALHHLGVLVGLDTPLQQKVRWTKLFPAVLTACLRDKSLDRLLAVLRGSGVDIHHALVETAALTRDTHTFHRATAAARDAGYPRDPSDATLHSLVFALRSPEPQDISAGFNLLCSQADAPAQRYPQLPDAIRRSVLTSQHKAELLRRLGSPQPDPPPTAGGATLCYRHKLGACNDPDCKLSHQLVQCPQGEACQTERCAYVHPGEIAWRWARPEAVDAVGAVEAVQAVEAVEAATPPRSKVPQEGPGGAAAAKHSNKAKKRQKAGAAGGKKRRGAQADPRVRSDKEEDVLWHMASLRPPVRPGEKLDEQEMQNIKRMAGLLKGLHAVEEKKSVWVKRKAPPPELLARYSRAPVAQLVDEARSERPGDKLLEACGDDGNAKGKAKPKKLPSFDVERSAVQAASLLAIVEGHAGAVPPRQGTAEGPPLPRGSSSNSSGSGRPNLKVGNQSESAWFKDISRILS